MAIPKYRPTSGVNTTASQIYKNTYQAGVADVNSQFTSGSAALKSALFGDMSNLGAEQAKVNPAYQGAIKQIGQNEFTTKETQAETMNAGGWNTANSGLTVGEMTRIGNASNADRAAAGVQKNTTLADIARRRSVTKNQYNTSMKTLKDQKTLGTSKAASAAQIAADNYAAQQAALKKSSGGSGGTKGLTPYQQYQILQNQNKDFDKQLGKYTDFINKNFYTTIKAPDPADPTRWIETPTLDTAKLTNYINNLATDEKTQAFADSLASTYGISVQPSQPQGHVVTGIPVVDAAIGVGGGLMDFIKGMTTPKKKPGAKKATKKK